jgi:hypothetical protein
MASAPSADGYGWTELRGDTIGTGESSSAELRRSLDVRVIDATGYLVMHAFALRSSATSEYVTVLGEVENTGSTLQCFVQATQITLTTSAGKVIPIMRDSAFVSGSLAQDDLVTDTCLAGGESGYFTVSPMSSSAGDFDALAQIELSLSGSASDYERPDFKLVPKRYAADSDHIQLELVNEGRAKAIIDGVTLVEFVLLDAEGLPVDMGYLEVSTIGSSVAPGGTVMAYDSYYFTGSSKRMKVLAPY